MALAGPHLIQDGRAVPISAERFVALTGRRPATAAAPRRPAPPTAAAPKPAPAPALTPAEVAAKVQAFDAQITAQVADDRAARRERQLQRTARMGGPEAAAARRVLAQDAAAAKEKAEADALAALPKSIEEAGGDARAYARADMRRRAAAAQGKGPSGTARERMASALRAKGVEPVRR